ncbi:MAG TPA: hypothetical protein VLP30_08620, partial [Desulfatirhabdiaceae bacterium]|nr:hypothetical protein [Desulfatirhabdiaceae bacterium]
MSIHTSRDFRAHGSKHLCSAPAGSHQTVPAVFGPIECGLGAAYLIHDGSRIQKAVAPPDIPCVIDKVIYQQMVMINGNFNLSEQKNQPWSMSGSTDFETLTEKCS